MSGSGRPDVLIVGGGIIGLACSRALARRGLSVEVLERSRAGGAASSAAAGLLTPLAEAPSGDAFFAACREARDLWPAFRSDLEAESGLPVEYDASGSIVVALDGAEEQALVSLRASAADLGEPFSEMPIPELFRQVPDVSRSARRALLLAGEHRVDNAQACAALLAAARHSGVRVSEGREVARVARAADSVRVEGQGWERQARWLVLAAGAWSGSLPGLPALPIRPVRGQMLRLEGLDWPWRGCVRSGLHDYAVRRGRDGLLVGATSEEAGFDARPTAAGMQHLLSFALRLFPGLASRPLTAAWAGLRPATVDGRPLLGILPGWPVCVASGHYRNGILLAPWTALQVANLLVDGAGSAALAPFAPGRFVSVATENATL